VAFLFISAGNWFAFFRRSAIESVESARSQPRGNPRRSIKGDQDNGLLFRTFVLRERASGVPCRIPVGIALPPAPEQEEGSIARTIDPFHLCPRGFTARSGHAGSRARGSETRSTGLRSTIDLRRAARFFRPDREHADDLGVILAAVNCVRCSSFPFLSSFLFLFSPFSRTLNIIADAEHLQASSCGLAFANEKSRRTEQIGEDHSSFFLDDLF